MQTVKVIKIGSTAVETRKQLRNGVNKATIESHPNIGPELREIIEQTKTRMLSISELIKVYNMSTEQGIQLQNLLHAWKKDEEAKKEKNSEI